MGGAHFTAQEYERRYAAIRKKMIANNLDGLLFCSSHGWFKSDGSPLSYVASYAANTDFEMNFLYLGLSGKPVLLGNFLSVMRGIIGGHMQDTLEPLPAPIKKGTGNSAEYLPVIVDLIKSKGIGNGTLGLVGMRFFPTDVYIALKERFPSLNIVDSEKLVAQVRVVKSHEEIEFLKKSGEAGDQAFHALADAAEVGTPLSVLRKAVLMSYVDSGCDDALQLINATYWKGDKKVPPPASSSGDPRLEKGQTIMPELTANYMGYQTQIATPISIGEPSQELVDFMTINDGVYKACRDTYQVGNSVADVDNKGNEAAQELSKGLWKSPFTLQTLDHEQSFLHEDVQIQNGIGYIMMPWYQWADGAEGFVHSNGYIGHAWGNAIVLTDEGIIDLHTLPAEIIIK